MSSGRLFQSFGPAEANVRSPTVTRRDGRTSSWLEYDLTVDDDETASQQRGEEGQTVPCRARYTRTASLKLIRSEARSQ